MNWREFPFVRILLPFALGIIYAVYSERIIPFSNVVVGACLLLLFLTTFRSLPYPKRWIHGVLLYVFLFLGGQQLYWLQRDDQQPQHFSQYLTQENTVIALIEQAPTSSENYIRCQLAVKEISREEGQGIRTCGRLQASFRKDPTTTKLAYGDLIRFQSRIRPTRPPNNPGAFDFAWYLKTQNCYYQTFVPEQSVNVIERQQGYPLLQFASRSRQHLIALLLEQIPSRNEAAVAIALSLGDRDYIDKELQAAYAGTGATHVLAVSGLHVGLVYLALSWLLLKTGLKGRSWWLLRILLLLSGIWSYALLTGASPSVLRAATMFSFVIIGENLYRHASIYNTLAVSAFILLCFNPSLIISPGFQLSYAAVVGIVYFQPKIYRWWYIENWLGDYCWKLTAVSLAAQLTTLPLSLYYFHQFPVYFWLSGLFVVPAAMLILPLCFLLFFFHFTLPVLLWPFAQLLYGIVWLTNAVIFFVHQLPGSLIQPIWIGLWTFLSIYFLLAGIAFLINTRKAKGVLATLAGILLLLLSLAFSNIQRQRQSQLTIYHHRDHMLIDIFYGKKTLTLRDSLLPPMEETRLAENHRALSGLKADEARLVVNNQIHTFQFGEKVWHVIRPDLFPPPETNILFVSSFSGPSIQDYLQPRPLEMVVAGAANKPWEVEMWERECRDKNITFYDIRKNGAFIYAPDNN